MSNFQSGRGGGRGRGQDAGGPGRGRGQGTGPHRGQSSRPGPALPDRAAVRIDTNMFQLLVERTSKWYQYKIVGINPVPKFPKITRIIVDQLQVKGLLDSYGAFDGVDLFFSHKRDLAPGPSVMLRVRLPRNDGPEAGQGQGQQSLVGPEYEVELSRVAEIPAWDFGSNDPLDQVRMNLLQSLLNEHPRQKAAAYSQKRGVFFEDPGSDRSRNISIGGGAVLWQGFFQSVKPVIGKIVVNIDIATNVMYKAAALISWAMEFLGTTNASDIERLQEQAVPWKKLRHALQNVRVTFVTTTGHPRMRRIRDLCLKAGRQIFPFTDRNDGSVTHPTIADYYKKRNRHVSRPEMFGVYVNDEKTTLIPAEFCNIVPGQRYMHQLAESQQTQMVTFATVIPGERLTRIRQAVAGKFLEYPLAGREAGEPGHHGSQFLQNEGANVRVVDRPLEVVGKALEPPAVLYLNPGRAQVSNGQWNVPSAKFFQPFPIARLACVTIGAQRAGEQQKVNSVLRTLLECCQRLGMMDLANHGPPPVIPLATWSPERIEHAFHQVKPDIIVIFLPDNAAELHKNIKYWGDTQKGWATQCSVLSKVKPNNMWCTNLALKMNARLGGINSVPVQNPRLTASVFGKPVMILGLDVTHPGPGVANKPSIAGLVASYDRGATKYAGFLRVQEPRMDFVDDLGDMVFRAIQYFYLQTKVLPVNLIFYRDGISEGQYDDTGLREQQAIEDALKRVKAEMNADIKLTYIVVEKRHHVRFFPKNTTDPKRNIDPGVLIDDTITSRNGRPNFYLIAHAGNLGTSRPAHYTILRRAPGLDDVILQDLSYYLCHVCAQTTRSVSVPAPVYYADELCKESWNYFDYTQLPNDLTSVVSGEDFDIARWRRALRPIQGSMLGKLHWL